MEKLAGTHFQPDVWRAMVAALVLAAKGVLGFGGEKTGAWVCFATIVPAHVTPLPRSDGRGRRAAEQRSSFNDLIGAREQCVRHGEAQHSRSLMIDD